jgi:Holliday junction resolvase
MVDSRAKGARAEADLVKKLKEHTKLEWKRIPLSGALDAAHGLKGDLYVPNEKNKYCIEVKHYADDHLTSKTLTDKTPQIESWWQQTIREAGEIKREPLLIFKFDRSKWFVGSLVEPIDASYRYIKLRLVKYPDVSICLLDDWLKHEEPQFI